jgi:hypothetical protein
MAHEDTGEGLSVPDGVNMMEPNRKAAGNDSLAVVNPIIRHSIIPELAGEHGPIGQAHPHAPRFRLGHQARVDYIGVNDDMSKTSEAVRTVYTPKGAGRGFAG